MWDLTMTNRSIIFNNIKKEGKIPCKKNKKGKKKRGRERVGSTWNPV